VAAEEGRGDGGDVSDAHEALSRQAAAAVRFVELAAPAPMSNLALQQTKARTAAESVSARRPARL
jgi:hypothetical protein